MAQDAFERLPADVRARYHRALGRRMLANSQFALALQALEVGQELAGSQPRLRSSIDALGALGELRLHELQELEPRAERPERDGALLWLEPGQQAGVRMNALPLSPGYRHRWKQSKPLTRQIANNSLSEHLKPVGTRLVVVHHQVRLEKGTGVAEH